MISKALTALTAALCLTAATAGTAAAQQPNNSDVIAGAVAAAPVSGVYAPGAGTFHISTSTVTTLASTLANGTPAQRAVAAVLQGGSTAALSSALTSAGAPGGLVTALMNDLSNLSGNPSPHALVVTVRAFNALVKIAPGAFVNAPPAELLAIRGALIGLSSNSAQ